MSESESGFDLKHARRMLLDISALRYVPEAFLLFGAGSQMETIRAMQATLARSVWAGHLDNRIEKWWAQESAGTDAGDKFARAMHWELAGLSTSGLTAVEQVSLRRFDAPWLDKWGMKVG